MGIYHRPCRVHSEYTQRRGRNSETGQRTVSHQQALHNNPQWSRRSHDSPDSASSHELHSQHEWFPASTGCSDHWPPPCAARKHELKQERVTVWFLFHELPKEMWQTYMSPMKRLGQTSSAWFSNLFPPYNTFTRSFTGGVVGTVRSCRLLIVDYENILDIHSGNKCWEKWIHKQVVQTLLRLYYSHVGTDKDRCPWSKIKSVTHILNVGQPLTSKSFWRTFHAQLPFLRLWPSTEEWFDF